MTIGTPHNAPSHPSLVNADTERRITHFLYREAELLHERRFDEWFELLADDLEYRVPVRVNRPEGQGPFHSHEMFHFDDDRRTIEMRIKRFQGGAAWAENPSSRCRYFVTNVRATTGQAVATYDVRSNLLVTRLRADDPTYQQLTGERIDRLREQGAGFLLASRTVLLDNSTLPMHNLALFL
jgi:3-phenylpropionate/cinnamic acid dioxygenase small subunit